MAQVKWILDDSRLLERLATYGPGLVPVLERNGFDYHVCERYDNGTFSEVPDHPDQCIVLYGSHQFVKAINPGGRFQPGCLGSNERTRASSYMSNLPLDWFLNREGVFMTWAMFKRRSRELFYEHDTNELFVRPDSGFKTFAGQVVRYGTIDEDIKTLDELSGVMPETMILVNTTQKLQGEFRFVISDGKIIAGSEYRWDGKLDIRRDWTPECEELAQRVASHEWQVDIAYTCDIALLDGDVKVIELNGFSSAGLYACDLDKVVKGVSAAALREFRGEDVD